MTTPAVLTATLTMPDAWGKPRTVDVEWMPLDITAMVQPDLLRDTDDDPAVRLFAHGSADDAPVHLARNETGGVALRVDVRNHDGELKFISEFSRVDRREDLEPGTFFIAHDSES